jgi:hypothetical protein
MGHLEQVVKSKVNTMKRRSLLFFFILMTACQAGYSQFEFYDPEATKNQHSAGDFIISASPNLLFNTPNGTQFAGGLKIKAFISKRISVESDLVFGRDYFHAGLGIIGIPIGLLTLNGKGESDGFQSFEEFLFYAGAIILSFEHMAYNIPLKNNVDISPYISVLRFKSSYEYNNEANPAFAGEQMSFAAGIEVEKYFGRFVLSPYAEFNIGYTDHLAGYNIGVYLGILFPVK